MTYMCHLRTTLIVALGLLPQLSIAAGLLQADTPVELSGRSGRFDFMEVDTARQRLLAAHKGAGTLELVDLNSGKVLAPVEVGHVQGIAVGPDTYVLGDEDEHQVVFVSAQTLGIIARVKVGGPVDAVTYDLKNGMVYADEDDGSHVWVVDARKHRLVKTISIPGVPEFVAYDPGTNRIYQNIKTKDSVVEIDPATQSVRHQWSTLPANSPHGLAFDSHTGRLFIAGHNGKLVAINMRSGELVAQVEIAPGTDQIAFDPTSQIIFCASKGFISVVQETPSGLQHLGDTPDPAGAHTLAVDSKRHQVWISYADQNRSYLQRYRYEH